MSEFNFQNAINACLPRDRFRLQRLYKKHKTEAQRLAGLKTQINQAVARAQQRRQGPPAIDFSQNLPILEEKTALLDLINQHQVIIVCGETGSGKSTQLPKLCLAAGRGREGFIGHTQPRRIAAQSIAQRLCDEAGCQLGTHIGYKVRFQDKVAADSFIKVMTDGVLLSEISHDRYLNHYDTIIIDEAHERSINIDFLLGYFKQLLPRRPDLKLIITSATIDHKRFSSFFADAPIIEVSGRTYPVDVLYRPLQENEEKYIDLADNILQAIEELSSIAPGDTLVFLSGEQEIQEVKNFLRKRLGQHYEILPLYARLSLAEQRKIFDATSKTRIILSTNVAETSLTVPDIKYVIDAGFARISHYDDHTKVQSLPIEKISQASANQRAGRCGRVSAGTCIRLYSEDDFNNRALYTKPEIQRTNLASIILQMHLFRLGNIRDFDFIDKPDRKQINGSYRLLEELHAIDNDQVTAIGKAMARYPLDPRLARILVAAEQRHCLAETLIICSFLSIQDPREYPQNKTPQADASHAQFADDNSEFIAMLNLWEFYAAQKEKLSRRQQQKLCISNFLAYNRMQEWSNIHRQLGSIVKEKKCTLNSEPADYANLHQCIITGLLTNAGLHHDAREYIGPRQIKFKIHPRSSFAKSASKWIICGTLIKTRELYAHYIAKIKPEWIESQAQHIIKREYNEPHWHEKTQQVNVYEKTSLYGLVLTAQRKTNYSKVDPQHAREIFIREALVHGRYKTNLAFFAFNQQCLKEILNEQHKSRGAQTIVDEERLYDFYAERIAEDICTAVAFENWYKQQQPLQPKLLFLDKQTLLAEAARVNDEAQFPDQLVFADVPLKLTYHFAPGTEDDGVTLHIPLALLAETNADYFSWLVPGLLHEKITCLIKQLPKSIRRNFIPVADFANACYEAADDKSINLIIFLQRELKRMTGVRIPADAMQENQLPAHLRMNFAIVDKNDNIIARQRNLAELKAKFCKPGLQQTRHSTGWDIERSGISDWNFTSLPEKVMAQQQGITINGYPTLHDDGDSVSIRVLRDAEQAAAQMRHGVLRLISNRMRKQLKYAEKDIRREKKLLLLEKDLYEPQQLIEDIIKCGLYCTFFGEATSRLPYTQRQYEALLSQQRPHMLDNINLISRLVMNILEKQHAIRRQLQNSTLGVDNDIAQQLAYLVYPGFLIATPQQYLHEIPRYLDAILYRLEKWQAQRDRSLQNQVAIHWQRIVDACPEAQQQSHLNVDMLHYRWMIEEFRISLFAQIIKTKTPVSDKRLQKLWENIR